MKGKVALVPIERLQAFREHFKVALTILASLFEIQVWWSHKADTVIEVICQYHLFLRDFCLYDLVLEPPQVLGVDWLLYSSRWALTR